MNKELLEMQELHKELFQLYKQETKRLKELISIAWYEGYCKSGEKELAYDLLENFKKENTL